MFQLRIFRILEENTCVKNYLLSLSQVCNTAVTINPNYCGNDILYNISPTPSLSLYVFIISLVKHQHFEWHITAVYYFSIPYFFYWANGNLSHKITWMSKFSVAVETINSQNWARFPLRIFKYKPYIYSNSNNWI
jgi:hypothetical protein